MFGPGFGTFVALLDKSTEKHWMVVVGEDLEREREREREREWLSDVEISSLTPPLPSTKSI